MKKILMSLLLSIAALLLPAGPVVDGNGNLQIGKLALRWTCYAPDWSAAVLGNDSFKAAPGFPRYNSGEFETAGTWNGFRFTVTAAAVKEDTITYSARFKANPPVETRTLALVMNLPADTPAPGVLVDGRKIELPATFERIQLFGSRKVHCLQFELDGRTVTIEGDFTLLIQDDRKWRNNHFVFRLGADPVSGTLKEASLDLRLRVASPRTVAVDLKPAFNMGFRDEKLNDGKGGWTDQGPSNDLSMMKPGKLAALGVEFDIADPARNDGRSCLVLSSGQKKFPAEKTVNCAKTAGELRYLYLLHASAWTPAAGQPVGTIAAEYADGGKKEFPVLAGRDVGNWWQPFSFPNGALAWTGENKESYVGLYLSCFPVGGTPRKLTFRAASGGDAVWMILGATLGDRRLNLNQIEPPSYIVAGNDWLPLDYDGTTAKGSPLDFSVFLDAPAGKYGPVTVNGNGHFSFRDAPEKRIRFFGPNLVGNSSYLDKKTADDFVTKIARLGYNTIRFHHFENDLLDRGSADSLTFDPQALDKFDYLFAELKKHGIYLCLDLYASRALRAGDNIEERNGNSFGRYDFEMKSLVTLSPSAMANWKEFARRLLTHRNPYTGLTYAEDPALYSLNLVNENPLVSIWNRNPPLIPLFEAKYVEFLKAKGLDTPENRASRGGLFIEFLNDLQIRCIEEQKRFLKQELKLTALITDLNMHSKFTLNPVREQLDFVDNHQYWDHPSFPVRQWGMPYLFSNMSSIARLAQNPRYLMPTRIFGKPYTVTEFNFCNPNPYRVEAAPLIGGYAGLQDWDGLYRFAWSHNRLNMEKFNIPMGFDIVNDPQAQLAERIINLLFTRDYIRPAAPAFAFTCTPEQLRTLAGPPESDGNYPDAFTELGLYGRIGTLGPKATFPGVQKVDPLTSGWQAKLPQAARAALAGLEKSGTITSAGGEITLDAKAKTLKVVAPKCEVFTFAGNETGKVMRLSNGSRYQTVALLSLDSRKLGESRSLLLIQMPNLAATKMKFANRRRNLLESWGQLPLLLEKCKADVELTLPAGFRVEALKLDGTAAGAVPAAYRDGKLRFTADTSARKSGVMVYHLTR
ncbi:glycoside hydrolase family 5 protein [Victivallis vadensis]|uniref:Cellulase (Glycosyl hydrolase family 5) n=1 Tax=Victivallis vadensis TaxID=172901 RepID=A0A2U1ARV2_9BACT|nr:hypothetical protein [Victivallis vadensis]PVY39145.1 hypothetical protein C8D82_12220 [Victivallis vadensis]